MKRYHRRWTCNYTSPRRSQSFEFVLFWVWFFICFCLVFFLFGGGVVLFCCCFLFVCLFVFLGGGCFVVVFVFCCCCCFCFYNLLTEPRSVSPAHTLKLPGRIRVQITGNTSSAYHVQHVVLRAMWYEGTAQLLSLTDFKSRLFDLYFIGWTICHDGVVDEQ